MKMGQRQLSVRGLMIGIAVLAISFGGIVYGSYRGIIQLREIESRHKLKQISTALENYHDHHDTYPPAHLSTKEGQPLLSWRVLLLPMLGEEELFRQFDLNQPWDSPHNRALARQIPDVYRSPFVSSHSYPMQTHFLAVAGDRTVINTSRPMRHDEIRKASQQDTIMLIEDLTSPVIWTKPADISPESLLQRPSLENNPLGATLANFVTPFDNRRLTDEDKGKLPEWLFIHE